MNIQLNDVNFNQINHQQIKQDNIISIINQIKNDKIKLDNTVNHLNSDIQKIKTKYQKKISKTQDEIIKNTKIIEDFCTKYRKILTQNNKNKYIKIQNLIAKWRKNPIKIYIHNQDKALQNCMKLNLNQFIRTKHEINKQAMKLQPDIAANIDGVKIVPGKEVFILEIE